MRNPFKIGYIDPGVVVNVVEDFIKVFGGGDKVPDYPVKELSTFNSLLASINTEIPLPPATVTDARRLLEKAIAMHTDHLNTAKWGSGNANQTVIMLLSERITALNNYIASNGGSFSLPSPGTGSSSLPITTTTPYRAAGAFSSPLLWIGLAIGGYFLLRKKR